MLQFIGRRLLLTVPVLIGIVFVVFALAREDTSALNMARKARKLGVQARWLTIPAFEQLRGDPDFQALLKVTEGTHRPKQ